MRTLAITMCLVLALAATIAVPIKDVGNDPQSTREKRSPSDWHSEPEGVWKKKLVWQEEWKQIWKTEKKLVWKTVEVPAWKKVWKPVWKKVWIPIHHEHDGWD